MLDFVFNNTTDAKEFRKDFFRSILKVGIKEMNLKEGNIEVSLNLVNETKIRELNKKYRNKDEVTDVLSFPMLNQGDALQAWQGIVLTLGDIFLCLSIAKKEAKRENISMERKLTQLTVHGFLHLLGYGHELSKKDAKKMFRLENKILSKIY